MANTPPLTLQNTTPKPVEMSVTTANLSQSYTNLGDQLQQIAIDTLSFKPFTLTCFFGFSCFVIIIL